MWQQSQPKGPTVVENVHKLARKLASEHTAQAAMFTIGFRIGLATALWRPTISELLIQELKFHMMTNSPITLQELAEFEKQCIEAIFNQDMEQIPTFLESN